MNKSKIESLLLEMLEKYAIVSEASLDVTAHAIEVNCSAGKFRFFYDFSANLPADEFINVPLFHWRAKRHYIELKNVLVQKNVQTPLALRIHHIVSKDAMTKNLKDVFIFESDLIEFITDQEIETIFADFSGNHYMNGIFSTTGGIKASLELGIIPDNSEPVLLHEIICKTGIISDVVVDTQTRQYPVYVFTGAKVEKYDDIDYELFGLEQFETNCIRFILLSLSNLDQIEAWISSYAHLEKVFRAAEKSAAAVKKIKVEE